MTVLTSLSAQATHPQILLPPADPPPRERHALGIARGQVEPVLPELEAGWTGR